MRAEQKVIVVDAVPACARGITNALQLHGYAAQEWTGQNPPHQVGDTPILVTLRAGDDWDFLRSHTESTDSCVVAVLPNSDERTYSRALAAGARSAVAERAPVEEIVQVLAAALDNHTLLPAAIAAAIAAGNHHTHEQAAAGPIALDSAQVHWLRALAAGVTVADIAVQACYSQREMYRLLGQLYRRMGARNRADAIVLATKWGVT
jgi:DNA-binding NarL/FixJ family response regulator